MRAPLLSGSHRRRTGRDYTQKILALNPVAYWPLNERKGTAAISLVAAAQNGTYSNVLVGAATFLDGSPVPFFNGTDAICAIGSAAFNTAFRTLDTVGSFVQWIKVVNAAFWTEGAVRRSMLVRGGTDIIDVAKSAVNNSYSTSRLADSNIINPITTVDWFMLGAAWNGASIQYNLNGIQVAEDATPGVWATDLSAALTNIGGQSAGVTLFNGYIAHTAFFPTKLTEKQYSKLSII